MLDLERMRYLLRKGLGVATGTGSVGEDPEEDLSNEDADELLNLSLWDLESKFPFREKECHVEATTTAGVGEYTLPNNLDAIISVTYRNAGGTISGRLERMSLQYYDGLDQRDFTTSEPSRYVRRGNILILFPPPDAEYILGITLWRSLASLLAGSVEVPEFPRNWHELVVEGAIVRGHFYAKDYMLAQQAANMQLGKIRSHVPTEAKEERDSGFARVRVITDDDDLNDDLARANYSYLKNLLGGRIP